MGLLGDDDSKTNYGLLGLMAGLGILGANQPGSSMGQAFGQGGMAGVSQYANQQRLNLQEQQAKELNAYRNAMLQKSLNQKPAVVQEFEYARSQGYQGSFEDYKNKIAGRNEQPSNVREWEYFSALPKDKQAQYLTMRRGMSPINLGDQYVIPNQAVPGQALGAFPKGIPPEQQPALKGAQAAATAAGGVQGTTQATAAVNLPQSIAQGEQSLNLVDSILKDPAFSSVVGLPGSISGLMSKVGAPIMGTPEAGMMAKIEQLGGQQFLQAFETLKGGGQITEVEGKKATDAISRMMKTNQSESDYRKAAEEFKSIIRAGMERARKKAGASGSGATGSYADPLGIR